MFFIDWERPKASKSVQDTFRANAPLQRLLSGQSNDLATREETQKFLELAKKNEVSIWRTYFVANEWIELQVR